MRILGFILLIIVFVTMAVYVTEKVVSAKYQDEITKLKGDVSIYQSQADNYAKVLRGIRESASTATPIEKAQ
ncbi:MAG TPA: hypothetical protein PLU24_00310 [Candidatus Omnitrophota bacterium]|nr:hypothetical protein [Candidatus Omnitrophota bacterium]